MDTKQAIEIYFTAGIINSLNLVSRKENTTISLSKVDIIRNIIDNLNSGRSFENAYI